MLNTISNGLLGLTWVGLALVSLSSQNANADGDGNITNLFVTGYPAPGIPGNVEFMDQIGTMDINNSGEVCFTARLTGAGVNPDNEDVIYSGVPGALSMIARLGGPAPGFPAEIVLSDLDVSPFIGDQGTVSYRVSIDGPGLEFNNLLAYFSGNSMDSQLVYLSGAPAPGTSPGVTLGGVFRRAFSDDGQVALAINLEGIGVDGTNNTAIYTQAGGGPLELVVREGDPLPSGMGNFGSVNSDLVINSSNQLAFEAPTTLGPGIFRSDNGTLETVVSPDQQVPGMPIGSTFVSFPDSDIAINGQGQIAFTAVQTDLTGENSSGIFSNAGGSLQPVAISGQDAPGVPLSGNFNSFNGPVINDAGDIAFLASLIGLGIDDSNNLALFARINGQLRLIAREGSPAAGTVNGVEYDDFLGVSINASGQIVFNANLKGNVSENNDSAIFVASNGHPELLVREGFLFDVDDSPASVELRMIDSLRQGNPFSFHNSGGQDGRRSGINDAGQVLFRLSFTDTTNGVFIANCSFVLGDVNGDGTVDLLDVSSFVNLITTGEYLPEADINSDGEVNLLDVGPFVSLIIA